MMKIKHIVMEDPEGCFSTKRAMEEIIPVCLRAKADILFDVDGEQRRLRYKKLINSSEPDFEPDTNEGHG